MRDPFWQSSKVLLDRALQYYADFPEAQALREMVVSWSSAPAPVAEASPSTLPGELKTAVPARDLVMTRTDGTLVSWGLQYQVPAGTYSAVAAGAYQLHLRLPEGEIILPDIVIGE